MTHTALFLPAASDCGPQPTASLRKLVEEVVLRSSFNADMVGRAAGLLADMVETGHFDDTASGS